MRKQVTTKSGYKTHIDRYAVYRNGRRYQTIWGKTKARQAAEAIGRNLFNQTQDKIEIVNEFTGECTKLQ